MLWKNINTIRKNLMDQKMILKYVIRLRKFDRSNLKHSSFSGWHPKDHRIGRKGFWIQRIVRRCRASLRTGSRRPQSDGTSMPATQWQNRSTSRLGIRKLEGSKSLTSRGATLEKRRLASTRYRCDVLPTVGPWHFLFPLSWRKTQWSFWGTFRV